MLREYEFTVISRSDLPEAETAKALAKYETLMTQDGGQIIRKDIWGSRRLAFPINKQFKGVYTHYDFFGKSDHLTEIERLMRIDENILRYLSINIGEAKTDADIEKRKIEINRPRPTYGDRKDGDE